VDVAILSLVDPLDAEPGRLAALLDDVLKDSLWKRTLDHEEPPIRDMERGLLVSRAEWLWSTTTPAQRRACFYSSLGRDPGLFLWDRLDQLVGLLTKLQVAVAGDDGTLAGECAVEFARILSAESFFGPTKSPSNWEQVLRDWLNGVAFADILKGRKAADAQRVQAFIQEGAVFRLVWGAEAVRVQALSASHPGSGALGDGPAYALTYGVPSVQAALLCQAGFASRVGALWLARRLRASFLDADGLRQWLRTHRAVLSRADFWESSDHYRLWMRSTSGDAGDYPKPWSRRDVAVSVDWNQGAPPAGERVRLVPSDGRSAWVCTSELSLLGTAQLPFAPAGAAIEGLVGDAGTVQFEYFGPH
jgi:hypothetical protein